jgi:hypothetical protein
MAIISLVEVAPYREPSTARAETPWENRRGFETIDYDNSLVLIRASIDEVSRALTDRTERWE